MDASSSTPAWRLVPEADAGPVPAPAETRARGWLRELFDALSQRDQPEDDVGPPDERLGPLAEERLARLAPPPPTAAQRAALDALRGRLPRAIVLRPDDRGWDEVLDAADDLASGRIPPPDVPPAGGGMPRTVRTRLSDDAPVHLTRIERWGVRHHDGLATLRELLVALAARRGPWTADVGPWAWAWMRHVLPEARGLAPAWAPAPLDGPAVEAWLGTVRGLRLRGSGEPPSSGTFRWVAALARGEAGVARAIWRACLRDGEELREGDAVDAEGDEAPADDDGPTVWLRPPERMELPSAAALDRYDLVVLHAVLLGSGPTRETVVRSLGSIGGAGPAALHALEGRGIVRRDDDDRCWVAPLALPSLTRRLEAEAFARSAA